MPAARLLPRPAPPRGPPRRSGARVRCRNCDRVFRAGTRVERRPARDDDDDEAPPDDVDRARRSCCSSWAGWPCCSSG